MTTDLSHSLRRMMKKVLLSPYLLAVAQLATALAFALAVALSEDTFAELVYVAVALGNALMCGFFLGRQLVYRELTSAVDWMPKSIHVNEGEDGNKVAIVEQHNGNVVSLELPDDVDNSQDAMRFII